jgi:hypothetical protein
MTGRRLTITLVALLALPLPAAAADYLSGAWTTGSGPDARTYVFKVKGDTFYGLVCGPCDDPSAVFRIEDGRIVDDQRVTFFIRYDVGGPQFKESGAYRDQVAATLSGGRLALRAQRERGTKGPSATSSTTLQRVVETFQPVPAAAGAVGGPTTAPSRISPIDGRWIANGRVHQQNFILKVRDDTIWGLVCGPCGPEGVFLIDDGTLAGNNLTFYINHIDTPPPTGRQPVRRNIMRGALVGNVMKFGWVREGAEDQPGGDMVLIGPIR